MEDEDAIDANEDENDLSVFSDRVSEPTITYETMLKKLKSDGKI